MSSEQGKEGQQQPNTFGFQINISAPSTTTTSVQSSNNNNNSNNSPEASSSHNRNNRNSFNTTYNPPHQWAHGQRHQSRPDVYNPTNPSLGWYQGREGGTASDDQDNGPKVPNPKRRYGYRKPNGSARRTRKKKTGYARKKSSFETGGRTGEKTTEDGGDGAKRVATENGGKEGDKVNKQVEEYVVDDCDDDDDDEEPVQKLSNQPTETLVNKESVVQHVQLPNNTTEIAIGAFAGCVNLKSIELPSGLLRIEPSAFLNCTSLRMLDVPGNVTSIGECAFYGSGLISILLPQKLELLSTSAIGNTKNLMSLAYPISVRYQSIGGNVSGHLCRCRKLLGALTSLVGDGYDRTNWEQQIAEPEKMPPIYGQTDIGEETETDVLDKVHNWLGRRFYSSPMHAWCYFGDWSPFTGNFPEHEMKKLWYHVIGHDTDTAFSCELAAEKAKLPDRIGMTALHILCCNPHLTAVVLGEFFKYLDEHGHDNDNSLLNLRDHYNNRPVDLYLKCRFLEIDVDGTLDGNQCKIAQLLKYKGLSKELSYDNLQCLRLLDVNLAESMSPEQVSQEGLSLFMSAAVTNCKVELIYFLIKEDYSSGEHSKLVNSRVNVYSQSTERTEPLSIQNLSYEQDQEAMDLMREALISPTVMIAMEDNNDVFFLEDIFEDDTAANKSSPWVERLKKSPLGRKRYLTTDDISVGGGTELTALIWKKIICVKVIEPVFCPKSTLPAPIVRYGSAGVQTRLEKDDDFQYLSSNEIYETSADEQEVELNQCISPLLANDLKAITQEDVDAMTKKAERNHTVQRFNLHTLYTMFGREDRSYMTHTMNTQQNNLYLAVLKTNVNVLGRNQTVLNNDLIVCYSDFKRAFQHIYLIQRNNIPCRSRYSHTRIDPCSLCSLYIADDLMRDTHFLVGEQAKKGIEQQARNQQLPPTTVIRNNTNYPVNFKDKSNHYYPVRVLNTSSLLLRKGKQPNITISPALHEMYRAMKKIGTNSDLLRLILREDACRKPSKRGFLLSFNFGITSQDVKSYKKTHLCGGTFPTLFGYNMLSDEVGRHILDFDNLCFKEVLPEMGLPSVFQAPQMSELETSINSEGVHVEDVRQKYSKMTRMALCKQNREMYKKYNFKQHEFTAPEAGTIAIYPLIGVVEPMNMLHPHIDSMNGYSTNYNHTITFSALFKMDDIKDEEVRNSMMRYFGKKDKVDWFHVVFIRYSRKVICDLYKPSSAANAIQKMIATSNCAAEKAILTFVMDKQYTDWDYDFLIKTPSVIGNLQRILLGHNPTVQTIEKFNLQKLTVNTDRKGSSYTYGRVITNKAAAVNKRCYDSSAADQTFSFAIHFHITKIDHYLVLAMLFTIYSSGPSLYIQALESLMRGSYRGQKRKSKLHNMKHLNVVGFCLLISKQMSYENKVCGRNSEIGSSTEQRSVHSNIKLPSTDVRETGRFETSFQLIKDRVARFWKNVENALSEKRNSFTKTFADVIYKECADMLRFLCTKRSPKSSIKCVYGTGEFTSMVFIQFAGVIGILPAECATFGHVSNMKTCGSLTFFHSYLGDPRMDKVTRKKAEYYNKRLHDISSKMKTNLSDKYTPDKIENIACEEKRSKRANDPIYLLRHRQKHYKALSEQNPDMHPPQYQAGLQNFFDVLFDKSKGRMCVCMARAHARNGTQITMTPIADYIIFDNTSGKVFYTDKVKRFMPYNAVVVGPGDDINLMPVE